jgi:tetratricopeptide (TPR) repeat protein
MKGHKRFKKQKFFSNHVDVAHSFVWLGNLHYKKGELEKAKDYYERAFEIGKEELGPKP